MSESNGGSWVEDCKAWTAKSVLEQMRAVATEATDSRGVVPAGGRGSFGPARTSGEVKHLATTSGFSVELHANGPLMSQISGVSVWFVTKGEDGATDPFRNQSRVEAETTLHGRDGNQETTKRVACLGLDCATGEPCLVNENGRRITVEEFVREVLLPVLFPGMVAVDHSAEVNRSA